MPARNNVSTNWTAPGGAANTAASIGNAGTSMCSAAGAIAVTRASKTSDGLRRITIWAVYTSGMAKGR